MNGSRLSSLLPYLFSGALLALLVGLLSVSSAAWMLWRRGWNTSLTSMAARYATLARAFPTWRANLSSLSRATTTNSLCTKCVFHTVTENDVILCCVRTKDVFPPHQPVLECGMHQTWFSIRAALTTGVVIAGGFIGGFLLLTRPSGYETLHHIHIVDPLDANRFVMASLDRDSGEWNDFQANFCPDFALPPEMYARRPIKLLKYRRDLVNNCWDISDRKAGIIFEH